MRALAFIPLLAGLAGAHSPQDTPQEILEKLEARYAKVDTAAMAVKVVAESRQEGRPAVANELSGELLLKKGRRVRFGLWGRLNEEKWAVNFGSNGKKIMVAMNEMQGAQTRDVDECLMESMAASLCRTGLFSALFLSMGVSAGGGRDGQPYDLRLAFLVENVKASDDEEIEVRWGKDLRETRKIGCRTLTFDVVIKEKKLRIPVKVWYEPKDLFLVKRTLSTEIVSEKGEKSTNLVTEWYENVSFGLDIPDEQFKLPGD